MKKNLLLAMICVGLLLPAAYNTSSAASLVKRVVISISGWVFTATSNTEEGNITRIEANRLPTGECMRSQNYEGNSNVACMDLQGLPHGNYSMRIICTNVTATKQIKL